MPAGAGLPSIVTVPEAVAPTDREQPDSVPINRQANPTRATALQRLFMACSLRISRSLRMC